MSEKILIANRGDQRPAGRAVAEGHKGGFTAEHPHV